MGADEITVVIAVLGALWYLWRVGADYRHRFISLEKENKQLAEELAQVSRRLNRFSDSLALRRAGKQTS